MAALRTNNIREYLPEKALTIKGKINYLKLKLKEPLFMNIFYERIKRQATEGGKLFEYIADKRTKLKNGQKP